MPAKGKVTERLASSSGRSKVRRGPSASWFKLGFPSGYGADVLENLDVLCELGYASDRRLQPAIEWLLTQQDNRGRWKNAYAYNSKTWIDFEKQGQPGKWVTLRACQLLQNVHQARRAGRRQ